MKICVRVGHPSRGIGTRQTECKCRHQASVHAWYGIWQLERQISDRRFQSMKTWIGWLTLDNHGLVIDNSNRESTVVHRHHDSALVNYG